MDGSKKLASSDATAVVAREFEPTRIERELLAQTFDLLCKQTTATKEASAIPSAMSEEATCSTTNQAAEAHVVGRRVA